MKIPSLTMLGAATALFVSLGLSSPSGAFTITESLGVPPTATDIVQFTCPIGTASARGIVIDRNPPAALPLVRLGLFKPGLMPVVQAAQEGVSPVAQRNGGPGVYWALFSKTDIGGEVYTARVNCHTAAGAILPAVGIALTQDQ